MRKFRKDRLQVIYCTAWLTTFSYIIKYLRISSYIRKPFLIFDFASCNWFHLNFLIKMRKISSAFWSVWKGFPDFRSVIIIRGIHSRLCNSSSVNSHPFLGIRWCGNRRASHLLHLTYGFIYCLAGGVQFTAGKIILQHLQIVEIGKNRKEAS
jgi:hypothetical protein